MRVIFGPLFFLFFIQDYILYKWIALLLFFIGSISDALDGYFARTYNWISDFGKNIDPFADKIFILSAFLGLFYIVPEFIPIWMLIVVLIRDVSVTVIRIISKKKNIKFKTSNFAKVKTVIQSMSIHISIIIIIASYYYQINMKLIYYVMFFSVLITFLTGLDYLNYYLKQRNDD